MGKFKTGLGGNLLNEISKAVPQNPFLVKHIPIEEVHENEKNEFSMAEIEELKQSIREVGLQQNLVVTETQDGYTLLTGHRRFRALGELFADGDNRWQTVPCIVKDFSSVNLNVSDAAKELYLIATTNVEQRKLTPADCIQAMNMLDVVYEELQTAGETVGKRRDFMAQRLGLSPRSVQNLFSIDKNLSGEIKSAFAENKLPVRVATELAKLPQEDQKELWETKGAAASEQEVKAFAQQKQSEAAADKKKTYDVTLIGRNDFSDIRDSAYFSGMDFSKTILKAPEMERLTKEKERILSALSKIEGILNQAVQRYQS